MKKKTLTIAIALVLVVALAVGATYAYLTATTGEVKNTFAVGNVIDNTKFALQEHKVAYNDTKGVYDYVLTEAGEKQVATSNTYDKLVPGTTAPKDPFITIGEKTQAPAYLFVKVTDTSVGITYSVDADKWAEVSGINGLKAGEKVYVYKVGSDNVLPAGSEGNYAILTNNQISVGSNVSTILATSSLMAICARLLASSPRLRHSTSASAPPLANNFPRDFPM